MMFPPANKNTDKAHTEPVCALLRPRLSPRLACLAAMVEPGARLADIGTDHGYLPAWLLQSGKVDHAIESDINEGPLKVARRTAEEYGIAERLDFRLCAGLDAIAPNEADTIVIAGMGGETIIKILREASWEWDGHTLLLQPMTKAELLRRWLTENEFRIASERLVRDRGTIYAVIKARAGKADALTSAEAWCGVGLQRDPLYGEYAGDRVRKLERAADGLRQAKNTNAVLLASLEADAAALRQKIEEWENGSGI